MRTQSVRVESVVIIPNADSNARATVKITNADGTGETFKGRIVKRSDGGSDFVITEDDHPYLSIGLEEIFLG